MGNIFYKLSFHTFGSCLKETENPFDPYIVVKNIFGSTVLSIFNCEVDPLKSMTCVSKVGGSELGYKVDGVCKHSKTFERQKTTTTQTLAY